MEKVCCVWCHTHSYAEAADEGSCSYLPEYCSEQCQAAAYDDFFQQIENSKDIKGEQL